MAIEYAPIDKTGTGTSGVHMIIRDDPNFVDDSGTKSGLPSLGKQFPFQVPPRITGDSKEGRWQEEDLASYEPMALWKGAGPRNLTVTARYLVDGGEWTGVRIAKLSKTAKAYFYRSVDDAYQKQGYGPIVEIWRMYDAVGDSGSVQVSPQTFNVPFIGPLTLSLPKPSTWRMSSVDVSRSENLVTDGGSLFPLWTEITFNLLAFTQVAEDESGTGARQKVGDSLASITRYDWF